ncbi:MAG: MBL fold metallo-hydrolase [Steroidobacteraceae bacterium]
MGERISSLTVAALMAAAVSIGGFGAAPACAQARPRAGAAAARPVRRAPIRTFQLVRGDIWRVGNGNWWSLVYVTPDGILLVDPITADFAKWMKAQFAVRFPGKQVRYIIYSHSHVDHIAGAGVFADSHPHIIGQERMILNLDGEYPHMPGDMVDRNNDGKFEASEIDIPSREHPGICGMFPGYLQTLTPDHKNTLTPAEWYKDVPKPDIYYKDRMTLMFGGRRIELIFPGLNHADDGTVVYFPAEKVVFSVDFPADALVTNSMRSLPSACGMFDQHPLADWIHSYQTIENLDFDILAQGHGLHNFTKQDVIEGKQFFEDLRDAVQQGMAQGKSMAELKRTIKLTKYKDWAYYNRLLPDDIEAAYQNLEYYR